MRYSYMYAAQHLWQRCRRSVCRLVVCASVMDVGLLWLSWG